MARLFTDLDNTILYSHRHEITDAFRLVERLRGKAQGYMTRYTYDFLRGADWLEIVPVTTRTQTQFARLSFLQDDLRCQNALVGNGALLLQNGTVCQTWRAQTLRLCAHELPEIARLTKFLKERVSAEHVHEEYPFFVYAAVDDMAQLREDLAQRADLSLVDLIADKRKLYCMPKSNNKANAVKRYQARFGASPIVAAGDSAFDYAMLESADVCFVPRGIAHAIESDKKMVMDSVPVISDEICDALALLREKGFFDD